MLQNVLNVVTRLLRTHGSALVTAKLLVVARLLHKTLSPLADAYPLISTLGNCLGGLRQRLLRRINRRLAKHLDNGHKLVEDLTAFSLATSSAPTDVLRHFHRLRADAICGEPTDSTYEPKNRVPHRVQLFLDTMRFSKSTFPDVLATSLKLLAARPLLDDPAIASIDELGLDVHSRWLSDEIKNYAPYARHDELDTRKAAQIQEDWSKHTATSLLTRIRADIEHEMDLQTLVEIRSTTLQIWLSSKRMVHGLDWADVLTKMRFPFMHRFHILVDRAAERLHTTVCHSVFDVVSHWDVAPRKSASSMWELSLQTADLSDGAEGFREAVMQKRTGTDGAFRSVMDSYETHVTDLHQIDIAVKAMRDRRWEDDYDDDDQDDDGESISKRLSISDPAELQDSSRRVIGETVLRMERALIDHFLQNAPDCSNHNSPGIFVLRVLRGLRHRVPLLLHEAHAQHFHMPFAQSLVRVLHNSLATAVGGKTVPALEGKLRRFVAARYNVTSLWAGSPLLPVQPTAATFTYLRAITQEMGNIGQDLWSPDAVSQAHTTFTSNASTVLNGVIQDLNQKKTESLSTQDTAREEAPEGPEQVGTNLDYAHHNGVGNETHDNATGQVNVTSAPLSSPVIEKAEPTEFIAARLPILSSKTEAAVNETTNNDDAALPTPITPPTNAQQSGSPDDTGVPTEAPTSNGLYAELPTPQNHAVSETKQKSTARMPSPSLQAETKLIQLFFDALYLSEAFATAGSPSGSGQVASDTAKIEEVVRSLANKVDLDNAGEARVRKAAKDYWRRTYLLFGLLAL